MIQRTLIAACLTLVLASLLLAGIVWHRSDQAMTAATEATRRLAEAQSGNQAKTLELLIQAQQTNAEILKQLQSMARASKSSSSPDWIPVVFKLALESPDGPPATGYQVALRKSSAGLFNLGIERQPDAKGLVDFGVIQPGDWRFELTSSTDEDEQNVWTCQGSINVLPGTKIVKTIVCPQSRPVPTAVKLQVRWPADLAEKNLRLETTFVQRPISFQPPLKWKNTSEASRKILIGPDAKLTEITGATELHLWHFYERSTSMSVQSVYGDLLSHAVRSESNAVAIESGNYRLQTLIVLRPSSPPNAGRKRERFEVLAHTGAGGIYGDVTTYSSDPDEGQDSLGSYWKLNQFKGGVTLSRTYWHDLDGRFSVHPGKANEWTIPLPDELIQVVRERLSEQEHRPVEQPRPTQTS